MVRGRRRRRAGRAEAGKAMKKTGRSSGRATAMIAIGNTASMRTCPFVTMRGWKMWSLRVSVRSLFSNPSCPAPCVLLALDTFPSYGHGLDGTNEWNRYIHAHDFFYSPPLAPHHVFIMKKNEGNPKETQKAKSH